MVSLSSYAQNDEKLRVAIFDPSSSGTSIDEGTQIAVREVISSTIVNTGKYNIVERSLLEKVMKEQEFSNSGVVDDMQATEVGKLAGANKIVLSVVTLTGGRNMISIKLIDVKTASVDRQKVKIVTSGELLETIEPLTLDLLDESTTSTSSTFTSSAISGTPRNQPANNTPAQSIRTAANNTQSPNSTGNSRAALSNPVVRSVMELINSELGSKANRYRTDEDRFEQVKSSGRLKEFVRFSAKTALAPIDIDENQVLLFCAGGSGKGSNDLLFLFIDGKMTAASTILNGFSTIILDDGAFHQITIWRGSSKIYSTTMNFSQRKRYVFTCNANNIQLN